MASYARNSRAFAEAGLQRVAIVVDSPDQNRAMVEKLFLDFPILSDPEGRVIREWGVWSDAEGGIAKPSLFLVDPDMSIAYSYVGRDFADRPSDDQLFERARGAA